MISEEQEERLNRFYSFNEHPRKITKLSEYYKYHTDIPRIFIVSHMKIMNFHHNEKRKVRYYEVYRIYQG